jgi:poly-gamma-glutamate capsule biosynthesis protein CapA/YwtB (metallophosphatase superfamily)
VPFLLAPAVCAVLLVACGGTSAEQVGSRSASPDAETVGSGEPSPPPTPPTPAPPTAPGPLGSGESVTIAFAGDASFEGLSGRLLADPDGLLAAISPVLGAADISMVNLEAALGDGGSPAAKSFAFRVPEQALRALGAAGVDVVTMANNHGMDYGVEGLQASLAIRDRSEMTIIGIGSDAEDAYSPFVTEVRGQRVGIIAANDVFDSSVETAWTATDDQPGIASSKPAHQERLLSAVRSLRSKVDTLAVYLHYGTEKDTCPRPRQQELVELLTGVGADIVVGTHAHRLQGIGYHGDRLVAYGLSNFVFKAPSEAGRRSGVLTVTATGSRIDGYDWHPAEIRDLVPVPLEGAAADSARRDMEQLRGCTGLGATPVTASSGVG